MGKRETHGKKNMGKIFGLQYTKNFMETTKGTWSISYREVEGAPTTPLMVAGMASAD
jgi:hypothetical protein